MEIWHNRENAKQLISFEGMELDGKRPTDIDAFLEWNDRIRIWYECKYGGAEVPVGQRLALERLVKDARRAGKHGIAMICDHTTKAGSDVILARCNVREVYMTEGLRWRKPKFALDAFEATSDYIYTIEKKERDAHENSVRKNRQTDTV